jgi:hypothetical protein
MDLEEEDLHNQELLMDNHKANCTSLMTLSWTAINNLTEVQWVHFKTKGEATYKWDNNLQ